MPEDHGRDQRYWKKRAHQLPSCVASVVCQSDLSNVFATDHPNYYRLDMLRGFSGAEKLHFTQEARQSLIASNHFMLEKVTGCPAELFLSIGEVLSHGKAYLEDALSYEDFSDMLSKTEDFLRAWDEDRDIYPSTSEGWKLLAAAYRSACLLRVLRFPDPFQLLALDSRIRRAVTDILDAAAAIPADSPFVKRLLFPLFMAGADAVAPHQQHYVLLRINQIRDHTSFRNPAIADLLKNVWEARAEQDKDDKRNVPWMEWVGPA